VNLPNAIPSPALDVPYPHEGAVRVFSDPVPYLHAWTLQSRLHEERVRNQVPDTVLILEHRPVYTLGRRTTTSHWGGNASLLCENGTELHHVNRGGSITFHGPGQIVVYPILKLARHATGPRQLVWLLEEVIIQVLERWNITGSRIIGKPGVWIMTPSPQKIAFLGIRIQHGVTLHGFALNVDMDLRPFQRIHPCGFPDCRVTSMAAVRQIAVPVSTVKQELARAFATVFALNWSTVA
jgi:lipoate-protein ligase B